MMFDPDPTLNIHEAIVKFWEDQGYEISRHGRYKRHLNIDEIVFTCYKGTEWICNAAIIDVPTKLIEYYLDGEWYSEEEMLRLIKLKAFL